MAGPTAQLLTAGPSDLSGAPNGQVAGTEIRLAEVLSELVDPQPVAIDQHFFDDLGADSMVMARFCARVRKRPDLPSVSMTDIYRHPTIRSLALALTDDEAVSVEPAAPPPVLVPPRPRTRQYLFCGTLQFLIFLGYSCIGAVVATQGSQWIFAGSGLLETYLRSVLFGGASFLGLCLLPIAAKWILVGRWKPRQIRIWSLAYVRFWAVKTLVRSNPLVLFVGSPLYALYLRALGARIGRGVAIFARSAPVCTDLLVIGDNTVIRQDAFVSCYRAHAGVIETGPVTIGKDVFVGEATVIDIGTVLGDGAQLGRSSSLHAGQAVPAGECWHGSPARRTDVDYRSVGPAACGTLRRVSYASTQLLTALALWMPLLIGGVAMLFAAVPHLSALREEPLAYTSWTFYADALTASFVLFFGAVLIGLLFVVIFPRMLNLFLKPGKVYPLYGFHYGIHRTIVRLTNVRFFTRIFGDSSAIVHYLRALGYDLSRVEQTGSNFGTEVKHEIPYLSSVGSATMVADGLSIINTEFSSTSFRVCRTSIGPRNFLGNRIAYPPGGRTGANCLLATKVMVPIDGPVREGVGLLGSPSFEIPRSVERDSRFDELKKPAVLRRRLAAKNRHNAGTVALFLGVRWIYTCGLVLLTSVGMGFLDALGAFAIALSVVLTPLFTAVYFVLVERVETAFHGLRPLYCSIYDRNFWRRERYWKVPAEVYLHAFNGTPFKNLIWRLLGVRMGRRVFDDGCYLTERALGRIGDDCTLNAGSVIQCHSQEDGTFKSDRTAIGAGATLGVGAFVHYGVTVGDGAVLAPDSFLMKGEEVPPHARWGGNPARELHDDAGGLPAPVQAKTAAATRAPARDLGIFALVAVPVLLLGLLSIAGLGRLVATAGEAALAAGVALHPGSALGSPVWPDPVAVRQIAAIDTLLTWPGSQNVVDAARVALVGVSLLGCLFLWPVARRMGTSAPGTGLAVALCGLAAFASGLHGAVDPGALAALWLTGAAALVGRSRMATLVAVAATLLAVLTVPLAAVARSFWRPTACSHASSGPAGRGGSPGCWAWRWSRPRATSRPERPGWARAARGGSRPPDGSGRAAGRSRPPSSWGSSPSAWSWWRWPGSARRGCGPSRPPRWPCWRVPRCPARTRRRRCCWPCPRSPSWSRSCSTT